MINRHSETVRTVHRFNCPIVTTGGPCTCSEAWFALDEEVAENLGELLACRTRTSLKAVWLALTDDERRQLRPSQQLAEHARSVLKTNSR